ncbi:MAG: phosphoribosylformylglycinamidine synthase subunit PurQ [Acidimicrobiales bacterium]
MRPTSPTPPGPRPLDPATVPVFRIVVGPGHLDRSDHGPTAQARLFGFPVRSITELRLIHLAADVDDTRLDALITTLAVDSVGQWWCRADDHRPAAGADGTPPHMVEIGLRAGVTDREGAELVRAATELGYPVAAASIGRRLVIDADLTPSELDALVDRVLHNEVIERWSDRSLTPAFTDAQAKAPAVELIPVTGADRDGLEALSRSRRLGLSGDEMVTVQAHFAELGREPTDAELETIAQTWSEHCSHKTFRARITVEDAAGGTETIDGLLRSFLRAATDTIDAPWVRSAFVDNAGIVAFDDRFDLAVKAETHNHPSALEPFGGANTGVGGVVRDILGVSARPVAISDILCFGPDDVDPDVLPPGVLHPRRVRAGVVAGVGDYGNKIGVPNVAGAIVHDSSYTTTPLVFAGCIGLLPSGSHRTDPQPGDAVVVIGGAVGRDGVGGATFSSQTMGIETADVAGSSVQIGDPVVEKGLIDLVVEARDQGLYSAITDCGAGGLSSAVGEMAETVGATVELDLVPRKYPGLAPWEVWLSEAQERMVLATPDPAPLLALARRWQVDAAVIGTFTGTGRLVVTSGGGPVVDLDTGFLHEGRPPLTLTARCEGRARPARLPATIDPVDALLRLLAHPSIRSNEAVVRTFDHEVLGGTLIRPYGGVAGDAPADGTALLPPDADGTTGFAVGIGLAVALGRHDTEAMAWAAVDEAVRNVTLAGADPSRLSLLDNFAWGDPTDPATLGRLVDACRGCYDAAVAPGAPFVSGKDSLYNSFTHPDGTPDPVTPTLVITALGVVDHPDRIPSTGPTTPGDDVWMIGPSAGALGASHYDEVAGGDLGGPVSAPDPGAVSRHRQLAAAIRAGIIRSGHDLAEGGLAVAAAEWALAGRLGLSLDLGSSGADPHVLFGEGAGRYLCAVAPEQRARMAELVPDAALLGRVVDEPTVTIGDLEVSLERLGAAYRSDPDLHLDVEPDAPTAPDSDPAPGSPSGGTRPPAAGAGRDRSALVSRLPVGAPVMAGRRPSVLIPIAPGTNRNGELADAFTAAGAFVSEVPLSVLRAGTVRLADHQLLALPGGFSYGDALGAGRLLGLDLTGWFGDQLHEAVAREMPIIGICNGFQALVRAGLLPGGPGPDGNGSASGPASGAAALVANDSHRFECRWVTLQPESSDSVWLDELDAPIRCPVAHAEGKLVVAEPAVVGAGPGTRVAFRYAQPDGSPADGVYPVNPNGSEGDAAGLVDPSGLVIGLMPHPEDHVHDRHDPLRGRNAGGSCRQLFVNGVAAAAG